MTSGSSSSSLDSIRNARFILMFMSCPWTAHSACRETTPKLCTFASYSMYFSPRMILVLRRMSTGFPLSFSTLPEKDPKLEPTSSQFWMTPIALKRVIHELSVSAFRHQRWKQRRPGIIGASPLRAATVSGRMASHIAKHTVGPSPADANTDGASSGSCTLMMKNGGTAGSPVSVTSHLGSWISEAMWSRRYAERITSMATHS
mmetsp:Transcript_14166/g.53231  ORF Transcript_14166/g.53231 Transcript_14166/m.53231 type:complete len:203 (+) Transcript_14166:298-906(+)